MIDGRILVSDLTVNLWVQEAIETDVERKALHDNIQCESDREWARMAITGRARLDSLIADHCECWCFGREDRRRIERLVLPIYEEARKFLDLPA